MFKLTPKPTFKSTVELSVPGAKKVIPVEIEFKHFSRKQIKEFFDGLTDKTDTESLSEIVVGWSGFDLPFSAEALAELIDNYPTSSGEIFTAFRQDLLEARKKT